jgi:hypothetical protein
MLMSDTPPPSAGPGGILGGLIGGGLTGVGGVVILYRLVARAPPHESWVCSQQGELQLSAAPCFLAASSSAPVDANRDNMQHVSFRGNKHYTPSRLDRRCELHSATHLDDSTTIQLLWLIQCKLHWLR